MSPSRQRRETEQAIDSPVYVRDRRIKALQIEPNAPLTGFAPVIEDAHDASPVDMTSTTRQVCAATEQRLRRQAIDLKRFHQQICLRVNERVLLDREQQRYQTERVDAQMNRLLQLSTVHSKPLGLKDAPTVSQPLARAPHLEQHLQQQRVALQHAPAMLELVEKALQSDASARDVLLASTRTLRRRSETSQPDAKAKDSEDSAAMALPPKQRAELYAAVRRRYMSRERERVQQYSAAQQLQAGAVKPHGPAAAQDVRPRMGCFCLHARQR
ncbi:hypothetical protein PINS_up002092 [Pythium insidiosum]|nr:hypothetical protein PINS_up002092 [Pythium insidiosum]